MRELVIRLAPGKPIPATGMSMPMGIGMMGFGGVLIILAAWHYHCVNRAIERVEVKANRGLVISVTVAVAVLSVATIIYMVLTSEQL